MVHLHASERTAHAARCNAAVPPVHVTAAAAARRRQEPRGTAVQLPEQGGPGWLPHTHPNLTPCAQILVDTLEAVSAVHQAVVRRAPGATEASAVDVHAVALFLFAQLYIRPARPRRARRAPGSAR